MRLAIQSIASKVYRHIGGFIPRWAFYPLYRLLFPPGSAKPPMMYIDIVSSCNLQCPSCPNGNSDLNKVKARMSLELFEQIIQKAKRDYGIIGVGLYNWTEPFLHPQLADFIRCVKSEGLVCTLSTNLNVMPNVEEVLKAGPDSLRISISGFTQEVYGKTHLRGNIERVKENMRVLSETRNRLHNHKTAIYAYFHKYRHNLAERKPLKQFVRSLGFDWFEDWAYYMPLERVMDLTNGKLSPENIEFVEKYLALPIAKAVKAAQRFRNEPCGLLKDQIVVDAEGDVLICCAAYEKAKTRLGNFLTMTPEEVRQAKGRHPLCKPCMERGLHRFFDYSTHPRLRKEYEKLAEENLAVKK